MALIHRQKIWCRLLSICFVTAVFLLASCGSGEPTEAEIFEAMNSADQDHRMFGDLMKMEAGTQKDGCEKIKESTYKCGIASKDGKGKVLPLMIFTKTRDKWQFAK